MEELERKIEAGETRRKDLQAEASRLHKEATALQGHMIATAAAIQRQEAALTGMEQRLGKLITREREETGNLMRKREALEETLAALQRIDRTPPPALAVRPDDALDAVRSAILLSGVIPELHEQAKRLRAEVASLAALRSTIRSEKTEMEQATRRLKRERHRLARLLEQKRTAEAERLAAARGEQRRIERLAREADSLKTLLAKLEERAASFPKPRERPAESPLETAVRTARLPEARRAQPPSLQALHGRLRLPVQGHIVSRFGVPDEMGSTTKGITLATRPSAQVIAPYDGTVMFAGPFREYGQLLILASGDRYHILLAGISKLNVVVGQRLLAGEPLGTMSSAATGGTLSPASGTAHGQPKLYVEIRKDGAPIDPQPWFAAYAGRVSG